MLIARLLASAFALGAAGLLNATTNTAATIQSAETAGDQFAASDGTAVTTTVHAYLWQSIGAPGFGLALVLVAIWWKPIRRGIVPALALGTVALGTDVVAPEPAYAYYAQHDYAEPYTIMPNESAFWVPDIGDNRSQDAFDSASYLEKNKIAAKRFLIPHQTLRGTGWGFWGDYYVPTGRLFIVNREPVSREWLADPRKGTSSANEGFDCQSSEGHNITVGVSISTKVTEADAAKFLYNFGVHPPEGQRTDPNVVFTSVFYGRSLAEVMDSKVRAKVGILVCENLMQHSLVEDSANAKAIMDTIRKEMKAYLEGNGITLDYVGWADTWTFDKEVQDSLNRHFAALQEQDIAIRLQPHVSTLQGLALTDALRKWNGATPGSMSLTLLPQGLNDLAGQFAHGVTAPAASPSAR